MSKQSRRTFQPNKKWPLSANIRQEQNIRTRKLRCKNGDALLAVRFDRFKLFATSGETVATQLRTSQHIRHAIAKRFRRTADAIKYLFRPRVPSRFASAINASSVINQQNALPSEKVSNSPSRSLL